MTWLVLISLCFYAYWRPAYLLVLCASIIFNYAVTIMIRTRLRNKADSTPILWFAIAVNLGALCFYKYLFPTLNFFARLTTGSNHWVNVILPLGISFFTFTQIAYLIDLQQSDEPGGFSDHTLIDYTLFATFFPHLIAGPIYHHSEIMPQFQQHRDYRLRADDLAVGFSWFIMGLWKKVAFADHFAIAADASFAAPHSVSFAAAWVGSLSYALQLYFDFSGYSDMALGLARMFSINFPLNFSSPYKALNIIDFWQRWHMTLTRYINMYIYTPVALYITRWRAQHNLPISRKAMSTSSGFFALIALPTLITLLLAGVWHGAGLQFVIFGLLHALYLVVNHAWRILWSRKGSRLIRVEQRIAPLMRPFSCVLTFLSVLLAQVFFRASGVHDAFAFLAGLLHLHSTAIGSVDPGSFQPTGSMYTFLAVGFVIVWCFPNTQQILSAYKPALEITAADRKHSWLQLRWRPSPFWGLTLGAALIVVTVKLQDPSSFLYFQF